MMMMMKEEMKVFILCVCIYMKFKYNSYLND